MPWRDVFFLSTCCLVKRNPQNLGYGSSGNGNHEEDDVEDDDDGDHDEDNRFDDEGRRIGT